MLCIYYPDWKSVLTGQKLSWKEESEKTPKDLQEDNQEIVKTSRKTSRIAKEQMLA